MKILNFLILTAMATSLSLFMVNCSSSGGDGGTPPSSTTETVQRELILFAGCEDATCAGNSLFIYNPFTSVLTNNFDTGGPQPSFDIDEDNQIIVDDNLYYNAYTIAEGNELWVLDLSEPFSSTNPQLVMDIYTGTSGSRPGYFKLIQGKIYFSARTADEGYEPWVYDPAVAVGPTNPEILVDFYAGSNGTVPYSFTEVLGKIVFAGRNASGTEFIVYDPTQAIGAANPELVDLQTGVGHSYPQGLHVINDILYFCADNGSDGKELHSYDPTQAISGTNPKMLIDLNTGAGSGCREEGFTYNNKYYFPGEDAGSGRELFVFDPAQSVGASNPSVVVDLNPAGTGVDEIYDSVLVGSKLVFSGDSGTNGTELHILDLDQPISSSNPQQVDIAPGATSSQPENFQSEGDLVAFVANDSVNSNEPWVLDLSQAVSSTNPKMIADINTSGSSNVDNLIVGLNGKVYFQADDGTNGSELYAYDNNEVSSVTNPQIVFEYSGTDELYPYDFLKFTYSVEVTD